MGERVHVLTLPLLAVILFSADSSLDPDRSVSYLYFAIEWTSINTATLAYSGV